LKTVFSVAGNSCFGLGFIIFSEKSITTAVMEAPTDYTITTDGKCTAYYNDDYANEITTARTGSPP
jgi:hypothetical protein